MSSQKVAASFRQWTAETFGLPSGATSPQNKISETEALESFTKWFTALLKSWDDDIVREAEKRDLKKTEAFHAPARQQLEYMQMQFDQQLKGMQNKGTSNGKAPMASISGLLDGAQADSEFGSIGSAATSWHEWVMEILSDWHGEARDFDGLREGGEPFAEGVVKGMKKLYDVGERSREREIELAKEDEREPEFWNGFPASLTHVQRVLLSADEEVEFQSGKNMR